MPPRPPTPEQQHAISMMLDALEKDFGGNETRAAAAFGMSQPMLHEIAAGTRKPGSKSILAFSKYRGVSIDAIYGRSREVALDDVPPELERVLAEEPPMGRKGTPRVVVDMALVSYRSDGARRTEEDWLRLIDDLSHVAQRHRKIAPRVVRGDETTKKGPKRGDGQRRDRR